MNIQTNHVHQPRVPKTQNIWTDSEKRIVLKAHNKDNNAADLMEQLPGRSEDSIQTQACLLGVSLKRKAKNEVA